jgi:nicotinate-nucleotide--dimethylbenzimidazole phosphoribosyltransferase
MQKIESIIKQIKPLDKEAMRVAKERQDFLTKPKESLGVLEDLSIKVAGITRNSRPKIKHKVIITMAGDHGVVEEEVSAYPKEVTPQMVYNFIRGGAGINVLAKHVGARVVVVDMGVATDLDSHPDLVNKKVAYGTKNIAKGPAMTRKEAVKSIKAGIEVVEEELKKGIDIVGTGDMGIGNTTPSSAIVAAITGEEVRKVTGRGTGINDAIFETKVKVIEESLRVNKPDPRDSIDVLTKVGGFEIGGLAGVILAGAKNRLPVVIDGFISGAAALIATELAPLAKDYLIAAHRSIETGHKVMLNHMGLRPLLDLNLRLGEGTGAALGIFLTEAGVKILNEMATFAEAGVSESTEK